MKSYFKSVDLTITNNILEDSTFMRVGGGTVASFDFTRVLAFAYMLLTKTFLKYNIGG